MSEFSKIRTSCLTKTKEKPSEIKIQVLNHTTKFLSISFAAKEQKCKGKIMNNCKGEKSAFVINLPIQKLQAIPELNEPSALNLI